MHGRRSMTARAYGEHGSENAGVSSEMQVGILHTESPRIPGEGSSALGKSGPNARPKAQRMESRRIFLHPGRSGEGATETESVTL